MNHRLSPPASLPHLTNFYISLSVPCPPPLHITSVTTLILSQVIPPSQFFPPRPLPPVLFLLPLPPPASSPIDALWALFCNGSAGDGVPGDCSFCALLKGTRSLWEQVGERKCVCVRVSVKWVSGSERLTWTSINGKRAALPFAITEISVELVRINYLW